MNKLLTVCFFYLIAEINCACEVTFPYTTVTWILDSGRKEQRTVVHCIDPLSDRSQQVNILAIQGTRQKIQTWNRGAIANMPRLSAIVFNNNDIIKIKSKAFINLTNLEEINFAHNNIEIIEEEAFSNLPIKILKLHDNKIFLIESPAFKNLPNLKSLYLWKNKLDVWDKDWFDNTKALKSIVLGKNNIKSLPRFSFKKDYFPDLWQIDLSENQLQHIHRNAFVGADRLIVLSLGQNRLKKIPDEVFKDCARLKTVFLHANNFTYFDNNFFNFTEGLSYLTVYGNPWKCACHKAIEDLCTRNRIHLNVINYGCMNQNNPVCVNDDRDPKICQRESFSNVYDLYYRNFDYFYNDSICTRTSVHVPNLIQAMNTNVWF